MHSKMESRTLGERNRPKEYTQVPAEDRRKDYKKRSMINMQNHVKTTGENLKYAIEICIKALRGG